MPCAAGIGEGLPAGMASSVSSASPAWNRASNASGSYITPTGFSPKPGVRIYRDDFGIPSIYADNGRDVWFGAGYAAAVDRLFEMDGVRRTGLGTLAELAGAATVPEDIKTRVLSYTAEEYEAKKRDLLERM